jgi:hypothetical protein
MPAGPYIDMFKFHTHCNRSLAWLEIKSTKHFWILFASPEWGHLRSIKGTLKKDNIPGRLQLSHQQVSKVALTTATLKSLRHPQIPP